MTTPKPLEHTAVLEAAGYLSALADRAHDLAQRHNNGSEEAHRLWRIADGLRNTAQANAAGYTCLEQLIPGLANAASSGETEEIGRLLADFVMTDFENALSNPSPYHARALSAAGWVNRADSAPSFRVKAGDLTDETRDFMRDMHSGHVMVLDEGINFGDVPGSTPDDIALTIADANSGPKESFDVPETNTARIVVESRVPDLLRAIDNGNADLASRALDAFYKAERAFEPPVPPSERDAGVIAYLERTIETLGVKIKAREEIIEEQGMEIKDLEKALADADKSLDVSEDCITPDEEARLASYFTREEVRQVALRTFGLDQAKVSSLGAGGIYEAIDRFIADL